MQSTLVLQLGITAMSATSTLWLDVHQHQAMDSLLTCVLQRSLLLLLL
jgi:hypothetical protein